MKILASHVDFRLFSKYRSMLMGIAIFEVMLGHAIGWNEITFSNPLISFVVSRLISTVHTPGFLLLSGLGLSYSYSRNNDIKQFYLRRLQRMWLPFIMMAAPVYAFICMKNETGGGGVLDYVGWVTSLGFWFGDANRWWYIALSVVLYAVFPMLYKLAQNKWMLQISVFSILSVLICYIVYLCFPIYFSKVYLALTKIPIFILGICIGRFAIEKRSMSSCKYVTLFLCLIVLFFILSRLDSFFMHYCDLSVFPITIWIVSLIYDMLQCFSVIKAVTKVWSWMGKYTLELYVLHLLLAKILNPVGNISMTLLVLIVPLILCVPVQKITQKISGLWIRV